MSTIATTEPTQLRAGDTWKWRREDLSAEYPATDWALKYRFRHPTNTGFEISAAADGSVFAVDVSAGNTAAYKPGTYAWLAWVEGSGERYSVDSGSLEVLPDFRAANAAGVLDTRSHARKVLEAIQALLEGRATKDQEEFTIGDRSLRRMSIPDLLVWRDRYQAMVNSEEAAERVKNGMRGNGIILARL